MKRIFAVVLVLLFLALIAGLSFAKLVQANPNVAYSYLFDGFETQPVTDLPTVTLISPVDGIPTQNETSIGFRVFMPETWKWTSTANVYSFTSKWSVFVGQIKSVTCTLDQTQILRNSTVYGRQGLEVLKDTYSRVFTYSKNVGSLPSGSHTLTVNVEAYTLYCRHLNLWNNVSVSSTFTFTTLAQPATQAITHFPTLLIDTTIVASVSVVSFGLVAYFLRRKRRSPA